MCSFWISSMVPMVRVLLLAKAKLGGGNKKNHVKHWMKQQEPPFFHVP